jgi:hypothetical protein
MSELHDDDIAKFLTEETASQELGAEIQRHKDAFIIDFYEYLEANEVDHAYSPDPEMGARMYEKFVEILVEDEGLTQVDAEINATEFIAREKAFADAVANLKVLEVYGFNPRFISIRKKNVQASLMINELPDGWIEAVGTLIPGDSLDLSKENDIDLYSSLAVEEMTRSRSPLAERIGQIIIGNLDELDSHDPARVERFKLAITVLPEMIHAKDPSYQPTVRAKIDELLRAGQLTPDQAAQLHALIDNPPKETHQ